MSTCRLAAAQRLTGGALPRKERRAMPDMICRKNMERCNTPGMCSPHGGCRDEPRVIKVLRENGELIAANATIAQLNVIIDARDARIAELEEKISILDDVLESARIMIVVIDNDSVWDVSNISAYHRLKESVLNATN
jgi:hypothetical protein